MASILGWALRFRLLVLAVAVAVIAIGVVATRKAPVDALPEYAPPYAEIQTEALGLSAEEVEQLITVPMEADLLNGVEGIDVIRSKSVPGLSSIVLVFTPGSDIYRERQLVQERLAQAHALPHVSRPPELLPPLSASSRVLMVGLSSSKFSPIEQSVLARWVMRPRLMGVPGVASVSVWGLRDQQLQVQVDPARLRRQGVTLAQVVASAGNAQVVSPLTFLEASTPGTGGFIETPQQRLQVRHLIEKIANPTALGAVPLAGTSGRLHLSDVATVKVGHQPLIGDAVVKGGNGLLLVVEKFPGFDTRTVSTGVKDALEELRPGLAGMRIDTSAFAPANYLHAALDNLTLAAGIGAVLLLLTFLAWRSRWQLLVVALLTIPLSLITAAWMLHLFGQTFNVISLAGLAAAIAVIVDEAVASVEAVLDRYRHARRTGSTAVASAIVLDASTQARRPLIYAALISVLAVLPVAALGGVTGSFFTPLVTAYFLAILAATAVALTVTPVLISLLPQRWVTQTRHFPAASRARASLLRWIAAATHVPWRPIAAAGVAVIAAAALLPFMGLSLVPQLRDLNVEIDLRAHPGASSEHMTALSSRLSRDLREIPGVVGTGAHVGRALTGDRVTNVDTATVWVQIDPSADHDATLGAIRQTTASMAGVHGEAATYLSSRVRQIGSLRTGENHAADDDVTVLTGTDQPLLVRIYGEDMQVLATQATRITRLMESVTGIDQARVDLPPSQQSVEIEVDLDKARRFGVTPGYVRRAEAALLQGIQVGSVFRDQKVFDVVVLGTDNTRSGIDSVRDLLIDVPGGGHLRLGQVADVRIVDTPSTISRDAVSRYLDVQANVTGRSTEAVAAELQTRLAALSFPLEYHAQLLTESVEDETGAGRLIGFAIGIGIAILLLLQAAFRSWRLAALVLACLPAALVGGVVVAAATGLELSLGSLLGLLALFGLATRTTMMMASALQSVDREAAEPTSDVELVKRAAGARLTSVLAVTFALAGLVVPFLIPGPTAGLEVLHPMAEVVLGGLVSVLLVTLVLLPALYLAARRAGASVAGRIEEEAEPSGQPARQRLTRQGQLS